MEEWKDVEGYEGLYKVSNLGRVKRTSGRILNPWKSVAGYFYIDLSKNKKVKKIRVNRLVALNFIKNNNNKPYVNHINEIKTDNRVENLEWVTCKENNNHGTANKRRSKKRELKVLQIKNNEIIKIWISFSELEKNNYNRRNIFSCCNGTRLSHKGYNWKYEYDVMI